MGFTLKMFFEGLQEILQYKDASDLEVVDMLTDYIKQYAKDCGLID